MELKDLTGSVLTLLILAVLLGVGLMVLGGISREVRQDATGTESNFAIDNTSYSSLSNSYVTTTSVTGTYNSTTLPNSCFKFEKTGKYQATLIKYVVQGCARNRTTSFYDVSKINLSYTYGDTTTAQSTLDTTNTSISGFANWFSILVVVIIAGLVVGLVIRSFGKQ